ncbi:hypothetical protein AMJ80_06640 [bacterium SM23_31]|nr:MAG: hypothetical protein AMJ80_06640 [bacterium SM23_31]
MITIEATVKKIGNCWYLENDFIGQLPAVIQTKKQVEGYLNKKAKEKYPNKTINVIIHFKKAGKYESEMKAGGR